MTHATPPNHSTLSRRRFVALSAAAAVAALAACGGKTQPTATTAPTITPLTPTPAASSATPAASTTASPTHTTAPAGTSTANPAPATTASTRGVGTVTTPATVANPTAAIFRPAATINVKQYGAAGDGKTDDTAAIQAAIDAAPLAGATVQFPPGTYLVAPGKTTGITIRSNLRLAGAGADSVLKIKDHLGDWQRLLSPKNLNDSVENVTVEDLSFDANILNNPESRINETQDPTYQTFIHITAGRNLHVQRCRFAPYSGVWAVSFVGQTIRDCSVTDSYFRFVMRDSNPDYDNSAVYIEGRNYIFSGNRFESTPIPNRGARACMEAHGGPAEVFNNTATGFQTILNIVGSYYKGGNPGDINCHDNTCTDALLGIMLWPTLPNNLKSVIVANNTIAIAQTKHGTVDTSGIYILFSSEARGLASSITIARNTIRFEDEGAGRAGDFYYNSSGIGVHNLGGASDCLIDHNTIDLAPSAGIVIGLPEPGKRAFQGITITNNTITNPGQNIAFPPAFRSGILVNSSASDITIAGNIIKDSFPTPRCPTAIAFDQARSNAYTGITVQGNTASAVGKDLPLLLPKGTTQ